MRVNQNLFGRNAQRNLFDTNSRLSKSIEKLSSGLRINRAADDAAGLAVSETLRAQVSGLGVSISNAQDGISLIQTAEGGLDRTHAILRRVRDLAGYSANGDKTDTDRVNYQAEVDQLLDEIDRISKTTEYNTKKLLNGQIGATASEAADVDGILQGDKVAVNGLVAMEGEYKFEIDQYADQAKAFIVGDAQVADVNAAGSYASLLGVAAATSSEEGLYSFKIESEGQSVIVSLDAQVNAGDSVQTALNKINTAFEEAGMNLTASYNDDYDGAGAQTLGALQITSNEFGSKHDIHVSVASEPLSGATAGSGLYLTSGSDTLIRNVNGSYALINSDLTQEDGKLESTTVVLAAAAAGSNISITTAGTTMDFRITARDGTTDDLSIGGGDDIDDVIALIEGAGTGVEFTALFDEDTGAFTILDNTDPDGTNTFKIENLDAGGNVATTGAASILGFYGDTTGGVIEGVRISKTQDYVLDVTDPNNMSGTLMGNFGDRSTYFEGVDSASPIVSSGIDPDRNGPEVAGSGGIAGISFTLEEKQLDETTGQNRFSILATKGSLSFQIGPNEGSDHRLEVAVGDMGVKSLGISSLDISTQSKAQSLLDSGIIDDAINQVSLQRGRLGAVQNRLDHTIKNLSVTKENLQAGESRIRDVDVADETLEFTRNQILSQAGTAMLAQANQIPQSALQLLG